MCRCLSAHGPRLGLPWSIPSHAGVRACSVRIASPFRVFRRREGYRGSCERRVKGEPRVCLEAAAPPWDPEPDPLLPELCVTRSLTARFTVSVDREPFLALSKDDLVTLITGPGAGPRFQVHLILSLRTPSRYPVSHPATLRSSLMDFFSLAARTRLSAKWRTTAMFLAPNPFRNRDRSSLKVTSSTQCSRFSMPPVPADRKRSSAALLPLSRTDVLGRPWSGVFALSLWMTLRTTRRVSSGGSSC